LAEYSSLAALIEAVKQPPVDETAKPE